MENFTNENILKALECCSDTTKNKCSECPAFYESVDCKGFLHRKALARINKLEKSNEMLTINMNTYGLTAERLAEENDRLVGLIEETQGYNEVWVADNVELRSKIKNLAREIFEEIEARIAVHSYTSKSKDYADGAFDTLEWVDAKIDEVKKKYIPEVSE